MRAWLCLPLVGAIGCGSLDTPDRVHDLRMLSLKADPPDQVFQIPESLIAQFLDAGSLNANDGVSGEGSGGSPPFVPNILPVTVSGLIADPAGAGRAVSYAFVVCPFQNTTTNQCDPADPNTLPLGQGSVMTIDASAVVTATFTPSLDLMLAAFQDDPYHGFDFLPLYVQLTISAGTESVVGFKRVIFTAWYDPTTPPPAADTNPFIPEITVGGDIWAESEVVSLGDGPYEFLPTLDPAWEVSYQVPTFQGTYLTFQEDWIYDYFATAGSFDFPETGGEASFIGTQVPIQANWTGPGDGVSRNITFWVVVRDGRGGENWIERLATYPLVDGGT